MVSTTRLKSFQPYHLPLITACRRAQNILGRFSIFIDGHTDAGSLFQRFLAVSVLVVFGLCSIYSISAVATAMRGDRWVLAAITTSYRRQGSTPSTIAAFAHLPSPLLARASRPKISMLLSVSRFYSSRRISSSSSKRVPSSSSSSTPSCPHTVVSATPVAEGGEGGGESWCGHELLNTVTTEWVQDHLDDPEVGVASNKTL